MFFATRREQYLLVDTIIIHVELNALIARDIAERFYNNSFFITRQETVS